MVLLLLISLALLLWMIQGELTPATPEVPLPASFCPACHGETEGDWLVCPHCQKRLRESCDNCHKSKQISQAFCPFCGDPGGKQAV